METTDSIGNPQTEISEEKIISSYKQFLLLNGTRPASIYKFCLDLGITEDEFYNFYGSFEGLEKKIWASFIEETINRLHSDQTFIGFTAREKILTFYYSLL